MEEVQLLSYLNGELSEEESRQVEDWVSCSAENRRSLEQVYQILFLSQRQEAYEQANVDAALEKFRKRVGQEKPAVPHQAVSAGRLHSWWGRYGVAIAAFFSGLILATGILLGVYGSPSTYGVSTVAGQRARVILPDGTAVWLNGGSELSYQSGLLSRERKVQLRGEAYFEVKRHEMKPFLVSSQGVVTKVLGTKFNVRARENEHKVVTTLLQGSVQMYCNAHQESGKTLIPGQTMLVDTQTHQSELYTYYRPEEVLLWIKGELRFTDRPLGAIMDCLSKVYNVKVNFSNPDLKDKRFTCLFKTDSTLDEILNTLSLTRHFTYECSDGYVLIKPVK